MELVSFIFVFDVFSLEFSVFFHLSNSLAVFFLNRNDLLLAVFNFIELLLHASLVSLLLGLDLLLMLAFLHVHFILEDLTALVLTSLQLLEERRVFKHLRAVFITFHLHFSLLLIEQVFALVGVVSISFSLVFH
jgi:hypothetical protein